MRTLLTALVVIWLGAAVAGAEDDRSPSPEAFRAQLERLRHPLLGEREAGRRALIAAMPAARGQVIAALDSAPWIVKLQLGHVLAADASPAAIDALLDLLAAVDDVQGAAISNRIVDDRVVSKRMLTRVRSDPGILEGKGTGKDRLRGLHALLLRAEIEEKFLARKSASGGTGYYKGQYDDLKYERKLALDVVTRIAMDEAFPVPGRYRTGRYEFLRPKPIDMWEIRDMAMNAAAELATADDLGALLRLDAFAKRLERQAIELAGRIYDGRWSAPEDVLELQEELMDVVGDWGNVVASLYSVDPDTAVNQNRLARFLKQLDAWDWKNGQQKVRFTWWPETQRAATSIRVGWYEDAVSRYRKLAQSRFGPSPAMSYYNLACAFASWSLEPGEDMDAGTLREMAMDNLDYAVQSGWSDLGWMDEDRDLDPIREMPRFAELQKQIEDVLGVTRRDRNAGEAAGDPSRPQNGPGDDEEDEDDRDDGR